MLILKTYRNIEELRNIQSKNTVYQFVFLEIRDILKENSNVFIDISSLVYYLHNFKNDIYPASTNFIDAKEDTTIIIEEIIASDAISFFPYIFDYHEPFFNIDESVIITKDTLSITTHNIYFYNHYSDLDIIMNYANKNNMLLITYSNFSENFGYFNELQKLYKLVLFDITSIVVSIEDNKSLIYHFECLLNKISKNSNIKFLINISCSDNLIKYFKLYFYEPIPLNDLFPNIKNLYFTQKQLDKKTKVLKKSQICRILDSINL